MTRAFLPRVHTLSQKTKPNRLTRGVGKLYRLAPEEIAGEMNRDVLSAIHGHIVVLAMKSTPLEENDDVVFQANYIESLLTNGC